MNSRERVKSVLCGKTPDVVPTDLWGSASRVHNTLYFRLLDHLNMEKNGEIIRQHSLTSYEDYDLADRLGTDFRHINIGKPKGFKSFKDESGRVYDEWGVGRDVSADYPTIAYFPLADVQADAIDTYPWPVMEDEGRVYGLAEKAKNWYENTDKAITATAANSGMFFELAQFLRGPEQFLMDLCLDSYLAQKLIDKLTDLLIELNLFYLKPIAPYLEWIEFTSDLGTQNAPFISRNMFKEFFKEPFRRIFSEVKHVYPGLKVFFHSCGAIYDFIPDLIDVGVDVLNPIQPLAMGMDPARIKENFGDQLVFHGAIDIQKAMTGSVADVKSEVKLRIDQMGKNGGYILSPNNHLQPDVSPENVIALYKTAKEYGVYQNV